MCHAFYQKDRTALSHRTYSIHAPWDSQNRSDSQTRGFDSLPPAGNAVVGTRLNPSIVNLKLTGTTGRPLTDARLQSFLTEHARLAYKTVWLLLEHNVLRLTLSDLK